MEALHAIFCGQLALRTLRTLACMFITLMMAAGPAMAAGGANDSFTVGIRIQSAPAAAPTPEQRNARNKQLYEEQKNAQAMSMRATAQSMMSAPIAGPSVAIAP